MGWMFDVTKLEPKSKPCQATVVVLTQQAEIEETAAILPVATLAVAGDKLCFSV